MGTETPPPAPTEHSIMSRRRPPSLESLPLECIQTILENLALDCHALYSLLLMNRSWFQMVIPFLYRSPMALIDATWPKLSSYSQILKKDLPPPPTPASPSLSPAAVVATDSQQLSKPITDELQTSSQTGSSSDAIDSGSRPGRSLSSIRRTSTTSSNGGGGGNGGAGYGFGYAFRTPSRSSSHSSTRSWVGDAFYYGRNDAVLQKDQRERLVKRKKMQVLWVLLNCTLSEDEHEACLAVASTTTTTTTRGETDDDNNDQHEKHRKTIASSTILSQDLNQDLDIDLEYFRPMIDYLTYYTHFHHPGLRFIIWKLFPNIDDAFTIEWRLINHCPERIRELFLESVQLQDMVPLVSKLKTLHRIKACHESWDVNRSIEFMRRHNQLFGTVRMLELEAYLPDKHDTVMDDNLSDLISQVEHLKILELAGFESLRAQLDLIPRENLKVLRLNCGTLSPEFAPNPMGFEPPHAAAESQGETSGPDSNKESRMSVNTFLSQCRQLEELLLDPVDENMLEWAVKERRDFEAGLLSSVPSSPSVSNNLAHSPMPSLVPLKILELSGSDSEHVATTISQAAEAFQDTLEVIKANSFSYKTNRTLRNLSWRCPMPRLRVLKVVGRSNLPLDFRSLQYCPALRVLDLSKYSGMRACSEALLLNLKYLTQLEYLGLSSFDHLTDSTLRTILGCMPRLKHLRLAIGDSSVSSSSALASSSISSAASPSYNNTANNSTTVEGNKTLGSPWRSSGVLGPGSGAGSRSSTSASGSGSSSSADMFPRSPFAALSLSSSSTAPSTTSPATSSSAVSPILSAQQQQQQQAPQQSSGSMYIITGQIQNQYSQYSYHHPPPPLPSTSTAPYSGNLINNSHSTTSLGGLGDMASSARSTSSLMDRFYMENNYLSLEGILDAIDGLSSDSKCQLEKLSIVLGKLEFEEHYRRLELYNQQHQDLEITVYRYAHAV
ncbi:hypothetical protein BC939DRAFT_442574 [Gamsiella multidivaricata]|uniref:uncharacterized protein n=1 Tax=Gamsiella multidivaricata TaxID=101098 RepID=UPI002220A40D|nr:uncharacterized protein BC939DRAFT_442574 [Gamsiella multidivaricata]KAI7829022.1 hypothetical protein BC939DRAFT_442574 [Gamsiella multidivaricata]